MRNAAFLKNKLQLKALKKKLEGEIRQHDTVRIEALADPVDRVLDQLARDQGLDLLHRLNERHRAVVAALARMTEKTYGDCTECGEEIPLRRLNAVPWAPLCLACQEQLERQAKTQLRLETLTAAA